MGKQGRLIVLTVLLWSVPAVCGEEAAAGGLRIEIDRQARDYSISREILRFIDHSVIKLLKRTPKDGGNVELTFKMTPRPPRPFSLHYRDRKVEITLPEDYDGWRSDFETLRRIVAALYLFRCGLPLQSEADLDRVPYWIQAGTCEYLRRRQLYGGDAIGMNSYPGIHAVAVSGGSIYPEDIIDRPDYRDDGLAFEIYCSAAEFLVMYCDSVSSAQEPVLADIMALTSNSNLSRADVFYRAAGERLRRKLSMGEINDKTVKDREKIRNRFWLSLRFKAVNYFDPLPVEAMESSFNDLCRVDYWKKHGPDGQVPAECSLDQLGAVWNEVHNREQVLRQIRGKLVPLMRESSGSFFSVLTRIEHGLSRLPFTDEEFKNFRKKEKRSSFQDEMKKLFAEFRILCGRQRKVEQALSDAEARLLSPELRFYFEFKALRLEEEYHRRQWPKANKLLDRLEKDYFAE